MSSQIIADAGIALLALVFFCIGASTEGMVSSLSLVWAGMVTGYLVTAYMGVEVEE